MITVFPNHIISDDKKLVNTDISNIGFLPILSDNAHNRGALNNANKEYNVRPSDIIK